MNTISKVYNTFITDTSKAYQLYQVIRFGTVLLGGVLLVKLGFDQENVSSFEWFMFMVYVLSFFWNNGFRTALSTFYPEQRLEQQQSLFYMLFVAFAAIAFVASCVVWIFPIVEHVFVLPFMVFLTLSSPAVLAVHFLMLLRQAKNLFYLSIWIHILYVCGIGVGYMLTQSITGVLWGLCVWAFIKFLYAFWLIFKWGKFKTDLKLFGTFCKISLPLIGYVLFGAGMDMIDGFLVKYLVNEELFASYRYGAKELPIHNLLITGLVASSVPVAMTAYTDTIQDVRKRLSNYMNWMFPLAIVLLFASPYLYRFFYSDVYLLSAQIFNVYLLILISRIVTPQLLMYALKENNVLLYISWVELFVNFSLSILFLKYFGIIGIAYATFIAYSIEKILQIGYLSFKKGIALDSYVDVKKYVIFTVLLLITYIITIAL